MTVELVIFNCDGVLFDSEPIYNSLLRNMLLEFGVNVDQSYVYETFLGLSVDFISNKIYADFGVTISSKRLRQFNRDVLIIYEQELFPVRGIHTELAALKIPFCIASPSPIERIVRSLLITRTDLYFDTNIFSISMIEKGQLQKNIYQFAAVRMKCSPDNCVVVEGSLAGIAAAQAANIPCISFFGRLSC